MNKRSFIIRIDILLIVLSAVVCFVRPSYPVAMIFGLQLAYNSFNRWLTIKQPAYDKVTPRIDKIESDLARLSSIVSLKG